MSKPVLYAISAFDATNNHTFTFSFSGGQIIKTEARIYNNETGALAYSGTCETAKAQFVLKGGSIKNSKIPYNIEVRVYINSGSGEYSEYSDKVQFHCITYPTFALKGLTASSQNTIKDSNYEVELTYTSASGEDEQLDSYQYFLYNNQRVMVDSSAVFYVIGKTFTLSYLSDDTNYYVRATGLTKNGMVLDTGFVPIYADYEMSSTFLVVDPVNRYRYGDILLKSNIISIEGKSDPDPAQYMTLRENVSGKDRVGVDLTANGSYVLFDENYTIPDNFDMELVIMRLVPNARIMTLKGKNRTIEIYMAQRQFDGDSNTYTYAIMKDVEARYTVQSNRLIYAGGFLTLSMKCENRLYEMGLQVGANVMQESTVTTMSEENNEGVA